MNPKEVDLESAVPATPPDPTSTWPLCAVCGKTARAGHHATDLGVGHDYVPVAQQTRERRCIDTSTGQECWVNEAAETVEFLGPFRGVLRDAPGGILAFVFPSDGRLFTAAIEDETRVLE